MREGRHRLWKQSPAVCGVSLGLLPLFPHRPFSGRSLAGWRGGGWAVRWRSGCRSAPHCRRFSTAWVGACSGSLTSASQALVLLPLGQWVPEIPRPGLCVLEDPSGQSEGPGTSATTADPFPWRPLEMGLASPALSAGSRGCCHGNTD